VGFNHHLNDEGRSEACPLPTRKFLSASEAAEYLGVSSDTFRTFEIPAYELGPRSRRWDVEDLDSFVYSRALPAYSGS